MGDKVRKGMIIKNTDDRPVTLEMNTRDLTVGPGQERFISAEEVRDPVLRENLQVRSITIVRPATMEETERGEIIGVPEEDE